MFFGRNKAKNKYKLDHFWVYCLGQSIGSKKKYRQVFDKAEIAYLGVELSLFNKLFDEKDWEVEVRVLANRISGEEKELAFEDKAEVKILKSENLFKYNFGWGNEKTGYFWEPGEYEWEVYLEDELVASNRIFIEDVGLVSPRQNPYLKVVSFKTYEAPDGDLEIDERKYLKNFNLETARYIMGELTFNNLVPRDWQLEAFFNYYDDSGMLMGTTVCYKTVNSDPDFSSEYTIAAGLGGEDPGLWVKDNFTLEIVFMDTIIAVIPFSVGSKDVERISEYEALLNEDVGSFFNDNLAIQKSNFEVEQAVAEVKTEVKSTHLDQEKTDEKEIEFAVMPDNRPLADIMLELESLIGLENIKAKVREYIDYIRFLQFRKESGIDENEKVVLHSVFTGNPGTGKTTVVKLLGRIYHSMGLLSKGHVHLVEASDLVSGYIRHSGPETKKAIEKARGGILFIDEAYMLFKKGDKNDFGPEAIAALITEMSDGKGDVAIMVAGYPEEMEEFVESNPGLKSRFRNYFHFEDYAPQELLRIAAFAARKKNVKISPAADLRLKDILTQAFRKRDRTFGNARLAFSLIEEAKINMGIRIIKDPNLKGLSKAQLSTLLKADIEDITDNSVEKSLKLDIDEGLLKEALDELEQLTGLNSIKQEVKELVKLSRYYREINRDILKAFSMHSVFMGNPGTGKTTVARIMAKVYKALGMLERGHLLETDASDLVAGFVGQTSIKTKELIAKAMGGILFVDEAYAITEGSNSGFGRKAIASLVKEMEDHRREFGLIVAGYTQNMESFLKSNPGLKSRFDQRFHFEDFTEAELWEIALDMFKSRGLKLSKDAKEHLLKYISSIYTSRDKFFGNARSIRKIVEKSSRNQKLRMANLSREERSKKMMASLRLEDVQEFISGKENFRKKARLGFRF